MTAPSFAISRLDHLVLTVRDIEASCRFYERILGFRRETFEGGRVALHFGRQKINLHPDPSPIDPKAARPTAGSADLCFVAEAPIAAVLDHVTAAGVAVEAGPVGRRGALGPMTSIYLRDPDGNLIEVASYDGARTP